MNSPLTLIGLPVALGIVMLGLGLGLTVADFRRVLLYPKAALLALVCQIVILPAVCFGLVLVADLRPDLAVGMMLLAASPGGSTANLYSHLFGGHVALNVTLTAINSVLAVVTLPLVVNLSTGYFLEGSASIGLQFDKVLQVFAIVLIPVTIGMLIRARVPHLADRMNRPVKVLSVIVLLVFITGAVLKEREILAEYLIVIGTVALLFNVASLGLGYGVPRLGGVPKPESIASGFEIGIHNSTLAVTIAASPALLNSTEMAVPAAIYGVFSFFTAAAFGYLVRQRQRQRPGTPVQVG